MSGSIKRSSWSNKSPVVPGETFPKEAEIYIQKGLSLDSNKIPGHMVRWNGFAREETLADQFPRKVWSRGEIIIDEFDENGKPYHLPEGYAIPIVVVKTKNQYQANIVTREAKGKELYVSERWPAVRKRKYTNKENNGGGKKFIAEKETIRVGITGHRPKRILAEDIYNWKNPKAVEIRKWMVEKLLDIKEQADKENKQVVVANGMALGVDLWFAAVCVKLNVPFIAFLPCKNQDKLWGEEYKRLYKKALSKASEIRYTTNEDYKEPKCMLDRNEQMSSWLSEQKNSILISVCNEKGRSGTKHMISVSKKNGVKNINMNPENSF